MNILKKKLIAFLSSWTRNIIFIMAFALVLRVVVVFVLSHYKNPVLWENGGIAQNIYEYGRMLAGFSRPNEPTSWQAPGYPYLLASAWKVFGQTVTAYLFISLIQAIFSASILFPVYELTRRWFGEKAAVWAAWAACVLPLYTWYASRLHQTVLVMAFHPWLLMAWLAFYRRPKTKWALAAGVGTGIAGLFQPVLLPLFGAISGFIALRLLLKKEWRRFGAILGAGLCTLLMLTPWTIRNYEVHGRLLLVKNSFGKEFWMGNNPHATGTGYAKGGKEEITNVFPPKVWKLRGKISEMELMDGLWKEALEYVRTEPWAFVQRTSKKIFWFWTAAPAKYLRSFGEGEALTFRWLHIGYWTAMVILIAAGLAAGLRWSREYTALVGLYFALYSLVYGLTHVGQARFRGEIEYIFIPATAAAFVWLWNKLSFWFFGHRPI